MGGKKIMGLPLYVWMGVAAAGLLLGIYLRRKGGGSGSAGSEALSGMIPITLPAFGSNGSISDGVAGSSTATPDYAAGVDPALYNDLLAGQASFGQGLTTLTTHVDGLVDSIGSLVYAVPSSGGSGASAPGNSPAQEPPASKTATKPAAKKKAPAKPVKPSYKTYKKDVKLGKGQELHFTTGKGYYAA